MKRGSPVIDAVLAAVLSVSLYWFGARVVTHRALQHLAASAGSLVLETPDSLSRFQDRVGWAWAVAPLLGLLSSLPLHRSMTARPARRLLCLLLPVAAALAATVLEVWRWRASTADTQAGSLTMFIGVDSLRLATQVALWSAVVAALMLALNFRKREAV